MTVLIVWSFVCYGLTSILVWGSIFEKQRNWIKGHSQFFGDLIGCTLCTSTWVGFFLSITMFSLTKYVFQIHWIPSIFFDGMFAAGITWSINAIIEFFEESRIK